MALGHDVIQIQSDLQGNNITASVLNTERYKDTVYDQQLTLHCSYFHLFFSKQSHTVAVCGRNSTAMDIELICHVLKVQCVKDV